MIKGTEQHFKPVDGRLGDTATFAKDFHRLSSPVRSRDCETTTAVKVWSIS